MFDELDIFNPTPTRSSAKVPYPVYHTRFSALGTRKVPLGVLKEMKTLMAKIPLHHPAASDNFVEVALRMLAIEDRAESNDRLRCRVTNNKLLLNAAMAPKVVKESEVFGVLRAPTRAEILSAVRVNPRGRGALKRMMPRITKVIPIMNATPQEVNIRPGPESELKSVKDYQGLETIFSRQERAAFINTTTRVIHHRVPRACRIHGSGTSSGLWYVHEGHGIAFDSLVD